MVSVAAGKAKGRRLQQWVRDYLLSLNPSLDESDIRSTSMGAGGEDILLSSAARKLIPYSIECKSRKTLGTLYGWLGQAKSNSPVGAEPIVVLKQDRAKPLVLVDAEYFFNLKKEK